MKWISAALCIIIWYSANSQTNIWTGGNYDGGASSEYTNPTQFSIWAGGTHDGSAIGNFTNPDTFSIWAGGTNDGASIADFTNPTTFSIWAGGINDGAAIADFTNTTTFSIWAGGTHDGAALASYSNPNTFSIWNGGQGDGFAWASNTRVCSNPIITANTTLTNVTQTTAIFSWTTFNYGSSYTILVHRDSCTGPLVSNNPSAACAVGLNTVLITGLIPGAFHCLTLQEHCDAGSSTAVNNGTGFYTIPTDCNPPTVLQHLGNTGSSTRIGWTPGNSNTSFQIMLIKQGTTDTFWHSGTITGSPMRDTITCLPTGSFFNYYIRENCGYSATGHSQWVDGFTTYTSTGCSAPTNQTASVVNTQNANLSWTDNTFNATPYQISYGVGIINAGQGIKTAVTIPTQISGSIFTHALFVSGGVGNITWFVREICGQCDTTTWIGPNTLPPTSCDTPNISSRSVGAITTTSATLSWTSRNYNSAAKIEVLNYSNSAVQTIDYGGTVSYTRSQPIGGLSASTAYGWRIKEYCTNGDSTSFTTYQNFNTPSGSSTCAPPTNQGIWVQSGQVLIVKWSSPLYGVSTKGYQVAAGMNISSPSQATTVESNGYYITQTPAFPTHYFGTGNQTGFTWYVRDICGSGDTSTWLGPYIMGTSKTDETGNNFSGIENTAASNLQLQLFPNPNNGQELNVSAIGFGENAELMIYNLQGEIVAKQILKPDATTTLDVSHLADAVYLCRIITPQISRSVKLVIQR